MSSRQQTGTAPQRIRIRKLRRGLDVPITGAPVQQICDAPDVASVALIGPDHIGLKPQMAVAEGDAVKLGQPLLRDARFPDVIHTAPAAGRVREIRRGARRVLQSVVIDCDDRSGAVSFDRIDAEANAPIDRSRLVEVLLASGLWTALRTRPYGKVPDPATRPHALFITAIDTAPLAADPAVVIADAAEDFSTGVRLLAALTDGKTYVCVADGALVPAQEGPTIVTASFNGRHPAGLPGTHIHALDPVRPGKVVWHIGYQDVLAVGSLLRTGRLPTGRIVAIGGPGARRPRLLRTRLGAELRPLVAGEVVPNGPVRVIAGDLLTGRTAADPYLHLGRFHRQITLVPDAAPREFLGWVLPSLVKFATARVHLRDLFGRREALPLTTNMHGSARAMVPVGLYEEVMPLDLLTTQLLRAVLVMDTDMAQALGVLELDEEDVAPCSFVCPSKYDYGMALRACLERIEAEG